MLWENINYLAEISYLPNTLIYEYDISKANINVLYSKGVIDKKTYDYLYNAERMTRQVYVGKLQRDKAIVDILKAGIIEAKKILFEANDIKDMLISHSDNIKIVCESFDIDPSTVKLANGGRSLTAKSGSDTLVWTLEENLVRRSVDYFNHMMK